jgi:CheY-like chemotaxis protein
MPEKPIILIADDDPSCQLLLTEFLKSLNVATKIVSNGAEAFDECVGNLYVQLVIMDIRMPVMDGLESVRLIRKYRPDLPVIHSIVRNTNTFSRNSTVTITSLNQCLRVL